MSPRTSLLNAVRRFTHATRHFMPEVRSQRWPIAGAMGILLLGVAMQLLEPWPLKWVIDAVARSARTSQPASGGVGLPLPTLLLLAAVCYVVAVALRATANYYESVAFAKIGNRVISRIRTKVYRHLQALPLSFHNRSRQGDLLVRIVGDVKLLRDVAVTAILPLLGGLLVLAGMTLVMFLMNWRLAMVAVVALPVFALTTMRTGRKIHAAARQQRQREGAVAAVAAEAIASVHIVKALSLESRFEDGFCTSDDHSARDEVKTRKLAARLSRNTDVVIATATAVVLWYGGRLALTGVISPGDLVVFLAYLKRGLRPLQSLAKYAARLAKAAAAGERIFELLEVTTDVQDAPGAVPAPRLRGAIRFDNVTFGYEKDAAVLQGLQLDVAAGEMVAIVGESGAGKSTILNLLPRFYEPASGRILLDGQDIRGWTIDSLRAQLSVVLQDTVLFAANVWDNIAYGATEVTRSQIEEAARAAEADGFIRALPRGYHTMLGERGVNLSIGQRQRMAIARAMVRNAPIVLLDEPATALDQQNKRLVREALLRLVRGRTTILVTHDLRDARHADRILLLAAGQIVEQGTHQQLMDLGGRYARLQNLQFQGTNRKEENDVAVR